MTPSFTCLENFQSQSPLRILPQLSHPTNLKMASPNVSNNLKVEKKMYRHILKAIKFCETQMDGLPNAEELERIVVFQNRNQVPVSNRTEKVQFAVQRMINLGVITETEEGFALNNVLSEREMEVEDLPYSDTMPPRTRNGKSQVPFSTFASSKYLGLSGDGNKK